MPDPDEGCGILAALGAAILVGCLAGYFLGVWDARKDERKRAVEAGAAKWEVDDKTGDTTFKYLAPKERP